MIDFQRFWMDGGREYDDLEDDEDFDEEADAPRALTAQECRARGAGRASGLVAREKQSRKRERTKTRKRDRKSESHFQGRFP